jgi:hypothetical protein
MSDYVIVACLSSRTVLVSLHVPMYSPCRHTHTHNTQHHPSQQCPPPGTNYLEVKVSHSRQVYACVWLEGCPPQVAIQQQAAVGLGIQPNGFRWGDILKPVCNEVWVFQSPRQGARLGHTDETSKVQHLEGEGGGGGVTAKQKELGGGV